MLPTPSLPLFEASMQSILGRNAALLYLCITLLNVVEFILRCLHCFMLLHEARTGLKTRLETRNELETRATRYPCKQ